LVFYDCPKAAIIYRDFSKGLRAAVVAKAACNLAGVPPTDNVLPQDYIAILNVAKVVVSKAIDKPTSVKL
jgi:hypothetical protein